MKKWIAAFLAVVLCLACAACAAKETAQPKEETKTYKIAYATCTEKIASAVTARKSVEAYAATIPEIDLVSLDNDDDAAKAVENVRTAISMGVDAYCEYWGDTEINATVKEMLKEAGIPCLAVQFPVPDSPLFSIDNDMVGYEMGKALGEYANANWKDADVAVLYLNMTQGGPSFILRQEAAARAIEELFPGKESAILNTSGSAETARQLTTDFLTAHPTQKVLIFAHIDDVALAAEAAAEAAGRLDDVIISSTGGVPAVLEDIVKDGSRILGTLDYFSANWGQFIMDAALKLAKGETIPEVINPEIAFVTKDNMKDYYPEYVK